MEKTILNPFQKEVLLEFKKTSLASKFYLSGGTALAQYYLKHRYSEDLDFFTKEELDFEELKKFINFIAKKTRVRKIEIQKGFGLYAFFLDNNKIDFGQYPFEPVIKLKKFEGILVESMYDIALNKAHTIAFRPRMRDFIDIYFILEKEKDWNFRDLLERSFEKFEMRADALQVGENLMMVETLVDVPVMISKIDLKKLKDFFLKEADKLQKGVWK